MSVGGKNANDSGRQVTNQGRASGGVGQFPVGQPREKSRGVNGQTAFPHFGDAAEDDPVSRMKEVLFPKPLFPGQIHHMIRISQHGPEEGTFGLKVMMSGKTLNRDRGGGIPLATGANRLSFGNHSHLFLPPLIM